MILYEEALNCSNDNKEKIKNSMITYCSYTKAQLNVLDKNKIVQNDKNVTNLDSYLNKGKVSSMSNFQGIKNIK